MAETQDPQGLDFRADGDNEYARLETSSPTGTEKKQPTLAEIDAVVMEFSPRQEVDQNGLTRTIFEHGDITFSFAGREETPMYPTLEQSRPTHLGRGSVVLKVTPRPELSEASKGYYERHGFSQQQITDIEQEEQEKWQQTHDRLAGYDGRLADIAAANPDKPEHIVAEQSAYGLCALLERLQPDNPRWSSLRSAVEAGHYDDETLKLIDMVTAVGSVVHNERGADKREDDPPLGEAVVVSALLGNEQASRLAEVAAVRQAEREEANLEKIRREYAEVILGNEDSADIEAFRPEDLVVVHATSYEPAAIDGGCAVNSGHDAAGYPRATVHTALNHVVGSSINGQWDTKDFVVIAGLDKMLEANGSPQSVNGADTWWSRDPGESLVFPGATVIGPGETNGAVIARTEGRVAYKNAGFTEADITAASEYIGGDFGRTFDLRLEQKLVGADGEPIRLETEAGQKIFANLLRDILVNQEITQVRGKEILSQDDDKVMPGSTQRRIDKMAAELGLAISALIHSGTQADAAEDRAMQGERVYGFNFYDPKLRRVAYASGMMGAGGKARLEYERSKQFEGLL